MAKARKKQDEGISLFPFMSVLASVIGILMLLIAALVVASLDTQDVAAIERANEAEELDKELEDLRTDAEKLQAIVAAAMRKQKELEDALAEYNRLQKIQNNAAELEKIGAEARKLLAESNNYQKTIDQITEELPPILEKIEELKAELAKREAVPTEGNVKIFPAGSGDRADTKPTFVEVNAEGLVLLTPQGNVHIRKREIRTNAQFLNLIDQIAKAKNRQLVFLVRDKAAAIDNYKWALSVALERQTQPGKLPVVGDGRIDLSLFNMEIK